MINPRTNPDYDQEKVKIFLDILVRKTRETKDVNMFMFYLDLLINDGYYI